MPSGIEKRIERVKLKLEERTLQAQEPSSMRGCSGLCVDTDPLPIISDSLVQEGVKQASGRS